ncbi:unnamed protein product [Eruca vesicaria subsp. sativa]|uniref:Uncharacterized protein n=1 Tax=Eruca vesicaria subsp. sativa TaxID=29727 RepID=A0ABC8KCN4_ERUVS|nr:unnamed protein product [Eruca vesicaria subsp. sativa]
MNEMVTTAGGGFTRSPSQSITLDCASHPAAVISATARTVPFQLELSFGGGACYQIPTTHPVYFLDLLGNGGRGQPPVSSAFRLPVMNVPTMMACGAQRNSVSSSVVNFEGGIEKRSQTLDLDLNFALQLRE